MYRNARQCLICIAESAITETIPKTAGPATDSFRPTNRMMIFLRGMISMRPNKIICEGCPQWNKGCNLHKGVVEQCLFVGNGGFDEEQYVVFIDAPGYN